MFSFFSYFDSLTDAIWMYKYFKLIEQKVSLFILKNVAIIINYILASTVGILLH